MVAEMIAPLPPAPWDCGALLDELMVLLVANALLDILNLQHLFSENIPMGNNG